MRGEPSLKAAITKLEKADAQTDGQRDRYTTFVGSLDVVRDPCTPSYQIGGIARTVKNSHSTGCEEKHRSVVEDAEVLSAHQWPGKFRWEQWWVRQSTSP